MVLADQNGESVVESERQKRLRLRGFRRHRGDSRHQQQKTIRNRTVLSMTVIACHLP
jgi:hypothetical protein